MGSLKPALEPLTTPLSLLHPLTPAPSPYPLSQVGGASLKPEFAQIVAACAASAK